MAVTLLVRVMDSPHSSTAPPPSLLGVTVGDGGVEITSGWSSWDEHHLSSIGTDVRDLVDPIWYQMLFLFLFLMFPLA